MLETVRLDRQKSGASAMKDKTTEREKRKRLSFAKKPNHRIIETEKQQRVDYYQCIYL